MERERQKIPKHFKLRNQHKSLRIFIAIPQRNKSTILFSQSQKIQINEILKERERERGERERERGERERESKPDPQMKVKDQKVRKKGRKQKRKE